MAVDKPIWNYVLPLIALFVLGILWFWSDGSLFQGAKDAFDFAADHFVPDITIGERSLKAGITTLEGSTLESADSLKATLTALSDPKAGKNCFARYAPLTTDMGDNAGTALFQFNYDETHDLTNVIIWKRKDVVASKFDVPRMKPCIIAGVAGNVEIAKNFRQAMERGDISKATQPYVYPVDTLHIQYSESYWDGNVIKIDQLMDGTAPDPEVVNKESKNFEDGGLIFKGPDNEFCFFPTNCRTAADEDGLENGYIQELGTKFDNGDQSVPHCHLEKGVEAITLTSNMDASSKELDCEDSFHSKPIDKNSKRIQVTSMSQNIKGINTACADLLPLEVPKNGCIAIIQTKQDPSSSDCASTIVRDGEVIPSTNAEFGLKPYTDKPKFKSTAAYCGISHTEWFTKNENALLCKEGHWLECSAQSLNSIKEVTLPNQKNQKISYKCTENGAYYEWTKQSGELEFQQYRGVELFGTNRFSDNVNDAHLAGEYPNTCDQSQNFVVSKCDYKGIMGETIAKSETGQFICPSQDNDCDNEDPEEFQALDKLSPTGCQVFLSGDTEGAIENRCGRSLVSFGTILSQSTYTSLYQCSGEETCPPFSPQEISLPKADDEKWVGCLLNHQWTLPETEQGDLLCSKAFNDQDGVWNECNQRVVGRCLTTQTPTGPKQFCCNLNKGENTFRFIETPKVSSE